MPSHPPSPELPIHPSLVLGVYAEELAHGARVAILGSAALGLAEDLLERGARLVHIYDPDPARVTEAAVRRHHRSLYFAGLPEGGDIGVRDGAFDLVIVPDLTINPVPGDLVGLVRRVLSPAGAALIASPNGGAPSPLLPAGSPGVPLGYYELYELIASRFRAVRMLGQAAFVGYAVAELAAEDPEPTIDTSLAGADGADPDWFVVLAGDRAVRLESFALIELPKRAWLPSLVAETAAPLAPAVPSGDADEAAGTGLANLLETEREAAVEALRRKEHELKEARVQADRAASDLTAAREALSLAEERREAAEARLELEATRRRALELDLGQEAAKRRTLEGNLAEEGVRRRVLEQSVAQEGERRRALEQSLAQANDSPELVELRGRVQSIQASSQDAERSHEQEVARLEELLRERGAEIRELRAEVGKRETLVRELLTTPAALDDAGPPEANEAGRAEGVIEDLTARLDRLAAEAAIRDADLLAARWKITQLEREQSGQR